MYFGYSVFHTFHEDTYVPSKSVNTYLFQPETTIIPH